MSERETLDFEVTVTRLFDSARDMSDARAQLAVALADAAQAVGLSEAEHAAAFSAAEVTWTEDHGYYLEVQYETKLVLSEDEDECLEVAGAALSRQYQAASEEEEEWVGDNDLGTEMVSQAVGRVGRRLMNLPTGWSVVGLPQLKHD